jgi:hypothetical protein
VENLDKKLYMYEGKPGKYLKARVCTNCTWFEPPFWVFISIADYVVCPECGHNVETKIGRYWSKEKKKCFGLVKENIITGFEVLKDRPKPPPGPPNV